ncbi:hypothetical protein DVH02_01730 [Streptomyces corynorhini]|uniref:Uncharacterized protein n=1 Tax=Streptomyces corynorhini TaxID=2282652 RepID=A0A370BHP9_9ACTN|nr:hypothetical protein DVH02_01730 [Streptomyces corynorhini]
MRLDCLGLGGGSRLIGDVLWFFFRHSGYVTLVDDNGGACHRAEEWLLAPSRPSSELATTKATTGSVM